MAKETIAKAPERRTRRTPLGPRQPLRVRNKSPEYEYRIANDTGDRIQELLDQDWEICSADEIQVGDRRVDKPSAPGSVAEVSVGQGKKAIVMRKRKDWYEEDQAVKQEMVKKTEDATKQEAQSGGFYGGVNIT
jgi:hypothetical protein